MAKYIRKISPRYKTIRPKKSQPVVDGEIDELIDNFKKTDARKFRQKFRRRRTAQ